MAEPVDGPVDAAPDKQQAPLREVGPDQHIQLVAGAGFEPATFGL